MCGASPWEQQHRSIHPSCSVVTLGSLNSFFLLKSFLSSLNGLHMEFFSFACLPLLKLMANHQESCYIYLFSLKLLEEYRMKLYYIQRRISIWIQVEWIFSSTFIRHIKEKIDTAELNRLWQYQAAQEYTVHNNLLYVYTLCVVRALARFFFFPSDVCLLEICKDQRKEKEEKKRPSAPEFEALFFFQFK